MDIRRRVRRLEWWNRALLFGTACVLTYGFTAQTMPVKAKSSKLVRTERLEIVDAAGKPVIAVGFDDQGSAGLFINDTVGTARLALVHDQDGSALFIRDGEGVIRIGVAQFAHGGGGIALHGPDSKGAAVLYFKEGGSLAFYDSEGETTLRLPANAPD